MKHIERAPAKINLSLRVLAKREDGFHEIDTLMAPLEGLADELTLDLVPGSAGGVELRCDDPALPVDGENLVLKAVAAFEATTALRFEGVIDLHKVIPSGAGLGGGSSDAAAMLRALDQLAATELGEVRLRDLAAEIGSDVPFFVSGGAAHCRGRGELVTPVALTNRPVKLLLAKPAFGVPSGWAYGQWSGSRELDSVRYAAQAAPWGEAINDLERPVFEKFPVLAALKTWLLAQPEIDLALMSGSGSTLFAVLKEGANAEKLRCGITAEFGESTWTASAALGT